MGVAFRIGKIAYDGIFPQGMKMEKQETAKTIAGHDVKRVHEKISDYLVRSEYDYICVINTQTGMLYVDTDELHADWDWTGEEHDYYDARPFGRDFFG